MRWDANLRSSPNTGVAEQIFPGARDEGVELGGDSLDLGVDLRGTLADDLFNLLLRLGSRDGISFDLDIDINIIVQFVNRRAVLVILGNLDPSSCLLLQGLDGRSLLSNDVGTRRLGDGNRDGLLRLVSMEYGWHVVLLGGRKDVRECRSALRAP